MEDRLSQAVKEEAVRQTRANVDPYPQAGTCYPVDDLERSPVPSVRTFETGATRSADADRIDPEGFLSPLVIERFCWYMHKYREQADGTLRASDNWQKGMPLASYVKGMWRHFLHLWTRHRGYVVNDPGATSSIEEDCCAILFNVSGYLHTLLLEKEQRNRDYLDSKA